MILAAAQNQVTCSKMRLLSVALLLLPVCTVEQALALSSTPGRSDVECTLSDAEKYAGYDEQQCRQLDDAERVLVCTQCLIDGVRVLTHAKIADMVLEQKAAAVQASCDASADVYFNKKGHYDQDKEAWRMRCYEKMGDGIIKPEDKSAP